MPSRSEEVSKITAKGQTTVPKAVRRALGVDFGGRIAFRVDRDTVTIRRADDEDHDPVVEGFLAFLERDMGHRPEAIVALDAKIAGRLADLVGEADVDLDAPIEGEVAI